MGRQLIDECLRAYIVSKVDMTLVSHNNPVQPGSSAAWQLGSFSSGQTRQVGSLVAKQPRVGNLSDCNLAAQQLFIMVILVARQIGS